MLEVTLWLGILTAAAAIITLRRIMSWRFMVRRAVWLDVVVTGFALWAFSGQGVTGTLTGVFAGLVFSVFLHLVHWGARIREAAAGARQLAHMKVQRLADARKKASYAVMSSKHIEIAPRTPLGGDFGRIARKAPAWAMLAAGAGIVLATQMIGAAMPAGALSADVHTVRCVNWADVGRGAACLTPRRPAP